MRKTKKELKKDQKELKKLISVAAPQTVVGNNGCPKEVLEGTVPEGIKIKQLCAIAVRTAASPQAAFAIKWALVRVGAPYACEGIGRLEAWRFDCSSFVSRAYAEGAGLRTAGDGWAPSTRNMVPWDGASLDPHYAVIDPKDIRPGDLALYDTCPAGEVCPYRHVVMYLGPMEKGGPPMMVHTNSCGSVAHVAPFTGIDAANLLGVRRVIPSSGEKIIAKAGAFDVPGPKDKPGKGDKKPNKPNKPNKPKKPEPRELRSKPGRSAAGISRGRIGPKLPGRAGPRRRSGGSIVFVGCAMGTLSVARRHAPRTARAGGRLHHRRGDGGHARLRRGVHGDHHAARHRAADDP